MVFSNLRIPIIYISIRNLLTHEKSTMNMFIKK